MSRSYTPGLTVSSRISHRCRRLLPIPGEVLRQLGESVSARDVVAQTFMPGDVTPLNLANQMSLAPADVPGSMLKREGERIEVGEPLARTKGLFGMFQSDYRSKVAGTVESISHVTGQVLIRAAPLPVQVLAYLSGTIVEVIPNEGVAIEAEVAYLQGIFGVGGETFGPLRMACQRPDEELTAGRILPDMRGQIIVGGARVDHAALQKAVQMGVAAVVCGGIDDQDLHDFLGYDLGVAITGAEKLGLTLIITEGFGKIAVAERTFALLSLHQGCEAAVSGATQIRAGVMRPEIVIPLTGRPSTADQELPRISGELAQGAVVRIIRDPYFGLIGAVTSLPPEPQVLGSGSKARVLEIRLKSDERVIVPRANVELIEG